MERALGWPGLACSDGGLVLTLDGPVHGGEVGFELATSELVFWVALARIATRHYVRPVRVNMPTHPHDPAGLETFFGARVRTGGTHALAFSAGDAARPFLTENEPMWRFLTKWLAVSSRTLQRQLHEGACQIRSSTSAALSTSKSSGRAE